MNKVAFHMGFALGAKTASLGKESGALNTLAENPRLIGGLAGATGGAGLGALSRYLYGGDSSYLPWTLGGGAIGGGIGALAGPAMAHQIIQRPIRSGTAKKEKALDDELEHATGTRYLSDPSVGGRLTVDDRLAIQNRIGQKPDQPVSTAYPEPGPDRTPDNYVSTPEVTVEDTPEDTARGLYEEDKLVRDLTELGMTEWLDDAGMPIDGAQEALDDRLRTMDTPPPKQPRQPTYEEMALTDLGI